MKVICCLLINIDTKQFSTLTIAVKLEPSVKEILQPHFINMAVFTGKRWH